MTYCYKRRDNGRIVELTMTVSEMQRRQGSDGSIRLEDGSWADRDYPAELSGRDRGGCDLYQDFVAGDALGVLPCQAKEAQDDANRRGVGRHVRFDRNGDPHFTSRAGYNAYMKAYGLFNKDACYGDASPA